MRADAQRNRERLTAAAQEVFSEQGAGASLDEIAKRAGVGPGTLYRHFPTRESLQEAVYRDAVERLCAAGDELRSGADPRQALAEWMRLLLAHMITRRGLAEALVNALGKQGDVFVVSHRDLHQVGGDLVDRAKRAGAARPDLDHRDLLWMIHGIAQSGAGEDGAARTQRLLSIMIAGSLA
ncbi:TetR/AcrR family transcriptional regulator [Actinoplanes sp. KI2]|uniref:TetR/AcrR family transcriptional regulator n=1 Tax=Actinoplanes sp. KI2 TaxID=2983315 RepID=UPI0021D5DEF2|nr:TetR/AcrR family transcriptional regulator [Actinoplanes sp. KI2]MCU7727714.1 TetR/AcrR family transcriptional regulator [Actinoplanes sp. KI2]